MQRIGRHFKPFGQLTDIIGAGIAIRKGNPELAAAMQGALDAMMEDGTYLEIANKWVGGDIR